MRGECLTLYRMGSLLPFLFEEKKSINVTFCNFIENGVGDCAFVEGTDSVETLKVNATEYFERI